MRLASVAVQKSASLWGRKFIMRTSEPKATLEQ
jgi:hypothetical protein